MDDARWPRARPAIGSPALRQLQQPRPQLQNRKAALARRSTDIGPALPRPHHARGEAGEEVALLLVAVMPQVKVMAVVVAVVMTAAVTAAMPSARGRIARGREHGGGERNHGDGGDQG